MVGRRSRRPLMPASAGLGERNKTRAGHARRAAPAAVAGPAGLERLSAPAQGRRVVSVRSPLAVRGDRVHRSSRLLTGRLALSRPSENALAPDCPSAVQLAQAGVRKYAVRHGHSTEGGRDECRGPTGQPLMPSSAGPDIGSGWRGGGGGGGGGSQGSWGG